MNQKFDYFLFDEQLEQLLNNTYRHTTPSSYNTAIFSFDVSDAVAMQTFMMSIHYALETHDEASVRHMLGWVISSARYPNLNYAISAYSGRIYQTAIFAADLARKTALCDNSMSRHYAYIASCLVMMHANERLRNDKTVVDLLLGCKAYLEAEIGAETREWVKTILAGLRPRWGAERFQNALVKIRQAQAA